jgi:hypothetical protein
MQRTPVTLSTGTDENLLTVLLELVYSGSGSGNVVEPERIASAMFLTLCEENSVCWNAAKSSSMRPGGSTFTCA